MQTHFSILLSFAYMALSFSQAQPAIDNYPFVNLDVNLVVFPFGMENPIVIGALSKSGEIKFDFPSVLENVTKEDEVSESSKLWYTIFSQCDKGSEMVAETDNIFSFDTGALSLWTTDNRYVGVVFTVSNEDLLPWIEDSADMDPILASYFELIYVASPFQYNHDCIETIMLDDGDAQVSYTYDLDLKAGFNFIEYKIENVHKTNPNVMASFPDKVLVTSVEGIPDCKWVGKYF